MKSARFISFVSLLLCAVLALSSCTSSFSDAEAYAKRLTDDGYTVDIITDDSAAASESVLLLKYIIEHEISETDNTLKQEKVILASKESVAERICVFYYSDEKSAQKAFDALKKQDKQLENLFGDSVTYKIQLDGCALMVDVTEKTE